MTNFFLSHTFCVYLAISAARTSTKSAQRRLDEPSPERTAVAPKRPSRKRKAKPLAVQAPEGGKRARRGGPKKGADGASSAAVREAARGDLDGALAGSDDDSTAPLPSPIEANLGELSELSDNEGTLNSSGSGSEAQFD